MAASPEINERGDIVRSAHTYSPVLTWLRTDIPRWRNLLDAWLIIIGFGLLMGWAAAVPLMIGWTVVFGPHEGLGGPYAWAWWLTGSVVVSSIFTWRVTHD